MRQNVPDSTFQQPSSATGGGCRNARNCLICEEFIVIDGGSTDSSGRICDEYNKDERFRVFHTENRGLSAARNRGLDEARGEWIEFVDSDDWVGEKFCEIPLKAVLENNADLVIFQRNSMTQRGRVKSTKKTRLNGIITTEQAIDYGYMVTWNKLYRNSLFDLIRYPEGHVFEDISITHKLIYKAAKILFLSEVLYYHRIRRDSISHTVTKSSRTDGFMHSLIRYNELVEFGYPEEKAVKSIQHGALSYCIHMNSYDALYRKAEEILDEIEVLPKNLTWKRKVLFMIWQRNKQLFHLVCRTTGKKEK